MSAETASPAVVGAPCRRVDHGRARDIVDDIAVEISIEVSCPGHGRRILHSAPLDPLPLALGHAVLEWLGPDLFPEVVGRDERSIVLAARPTPPREPSPPPFLAAADVVPLMRTFIAGNGLWDGTGCFHRAAALDPVGGTFLCRAEDIGRHNCLDRLAGWAVQSGHDLSGLVLFVSARITASMLEKARRAGFTLVVSRSAVTTAAVSGALAAGVTLIGFAREAEERFTVFADPGRRVRW